MCALLEEGVDHRFLGQSLVGDRIGVGAELADTHQKLDVLMTGQKLADAV